MSARSITVCHPAKGKIKKLLNNIKKLTRKYKFLLTNRPNFPRTLPQLSALSPILFGPSLNFPTDMGFRIFSEKNGVEEIAAGTDQRVFVTWPAETTRRQADKNVANIDHQVGLGHRWRKTWQPVDASVHHLQTPGNVKSPHVIERATARLGQVSTLPISHRST